MVAVIRLIVVMIVAVLKMIISGIGRMVTIMVLVFRFMVYC